ncbi:hypothetical protein PPGU19_006270 [Paraburkholderia sp. PGU19]|nr:hypothetical protein PPGU19_006270 [Paraburkholderia sp. PGU19]
MSRRCEPMSEEYESICSAFELMIVFGRLKVKAQHAAFRGAARWDGLLPRTRHARNAAGQAIARLLRCIKFDSAEARTNPNAKKYQSAVSFLVAAVAPWV